jgi:hypothetical protein
MAEKAKLLYPYCYGTICGKSLIWSAMENNRHGFDLQKWVCYSFKGRKE